MTSLMNRFDANVLQPGDLDYDEARKVWNAAVDRRPRMIARCATVADVVGAVRTARERDLEIGVRCGGHSVLGLAVPNGGLMIDLTPMGAARVDPAQRRAWVQGGALLRALDEAAQRHGLATASVFGGIAEAQQLGSPTLLDSVRAAFVVGMDDALRVTAIVALAAIVLAVLFLPGRRPATQTAAAPQAGAAA